MLAKSGTYQNNLKLRLVVVNTVIERRDTLHGSDIDSGAEMVSLAKSRETVMPSIQRLSNVVENGQGLRVCCGTCSATKTVDPRTLGLPEDMPLAEVRRTLKCDDCGGHWVDVRVTEASAGSVVNKHRPARIRR